MLGPIRLTKPFPFALGFLGEVEWGRISISRLFLSTYGQTLNQACHIFALQLALLSGKALCIFQQITTETSVKALIFCVPVCVSMLDGFVVWFHTLFQRDLVALFAHVCHLYLCSWLPLVCLCVSLWPG